MSKFINFLYEFMSVFFDGFKSIFLGIFNGFVQMFNIPKYIGVIGDYTRVFGIKEWILAAIAIVIMIVILGLIILLGYFIVRKYIRFRKKIVEQDELLNEIAVLNNKVADLVNEKEQILAMKVSQMGLKPDESAEIMSTSSEGSEEGANEETVSDGVRFTKLSNIDLMLKDYKLQNYNNTFTLQELVSLFRNFAASKLHLYYTEEMIRLFISSLACTKLVILQGISGTGKTSLAYAWGKFIKNDAIIASVQPSWRDRTELFGYFNEFTKKFNETEILKKMYEAGYNDDVYVAVLDEMNIARVEYYFAEMLSILEMPSRDEWIVELVPSSWPDDPKHLVDGKLKIPGNMWYIGTINNDDSTFAVTDKVYDRAMPIDINDKGQVFEPIDTDAMNINSSYLEGLYARAKELHPLSEEMSKKVEEMDDYVIKHFRIAFGNRIVKQMGDFVSAYVECGGEEVDGVDYFIARKILRKFEQLNLAYIRDEIDGFVKFLDQEFGKEHFGECKEYLLRLKKMV